MKPASFEHLPGAVAGGIVPASSPHGVGILTAAMLRARAAWSPSPARASRRAATSRGGFDLGRAFVRAGRP